MPSLPERGEGFVGDLAGSPDVVFRVCRGDGVFVVAEQVGPALNALRDPLLMPLAAPSAAILEVGHSRDAGAPVVVAVGRGHLAELLGEGGDAMRRIGLLGGLEGG